MARRMIPAGATKPKVAKSSGRAAGSSVAVKKTPSIGTGFSRGEKVQTSLTHGTGIRKPYTGLAKPSAARGRKALGKAVGLGG